MASFGLGDAADSTRVALSIRAARAPKYPASARRRLVDARGRRIHGHGSFRVQQCRLAHRASLRSQRSCIAVRRRYGFAFVDFPARAAGA